MLEDLSKIAAIHPPATGRTADEMLSLARRKIAETLSHIFPAGEVDHLEIALRSSRSVVEDGERSMLQWTRDFDYSANGSRNGDHRGRCAVHS